jgi:peptidoglycan hydrolase CwlO-like protein
METEVSINWTVIISVVTVCLAAMGTLIGIYRRPPKTLEEENASARAEAQADQNTKDIERIEEDLKEHIKEHNEKIDDVREKVNTLDKEIATINTNYANLEKGVEEMKVHNAEVVEKFDILLNQIMDWLDDT